VSTRGISSYLRPELDGSLRKMLEGVWHFPMFDDYGTHETGLAAFKRQEKDGLHLVKDMFIVEVADVDTD
jgi:phenylacetate-coenzyme A ligase PaaK-like adenylate-forming protein